MLPVMNAFTAALVLMMLPCGLASLERKQARSMVITQRGIVATSQVLASQAGAQALARGGSAVDAAIVANAVLAVVEPMSNGIGGDLFAIYWDAKTGDLFGLNASGWAPKALTLDLLRTRGHPSMPETGILSVTVPGCVAGWYALHQRFGRLPWRELFQPAIYYAENGFPVTEWIHMEWEAAAEKLRAPEAQPELFLPGGKAPAVGQLFRNPDLARALRLIATDGPKAFYEGPIAEAILKVSAQLRGVLSPDDLREYQPEWVKPIATTYRGWTVYELPPNSQGVAALEMLNIMEQFPLHQRAFDEPLTLHIKIEAQKLAYEDLRATVGDPRFVQVPLERLLSKDYARERARRIDLQHARCIEDRPAPPKGGDTVYLTAVDKDGNIVSLIQSIYLAFGSAIAVRPYGFHLHNRGGLFVTDPNSPNVVAPRKRPFHTIIPGFMERGPIRIGFGIMGGLNQAQAHAQFVSHVVDHGMNIQMALEAPRFTRREWTGCRVLIEDRFPKSTLDQLSVLGHQLEVPGSFVSWMGGGQVVLYDQSTGVKYGASSPRKDGAAIPEPDPYWSSR